MLNNCVVFGNLALFLLQLAECSIINAMNLVVIHYTAGRNVKIHFVGIQRIQSGLIGNKRRVGSGQS